MSAKRVRAANDSAKRVRAANDNRRPGPTILQRLFLAPVYLYRYTLSAFIGRTCRHMPSCSEYMIEAVEKHGVWPGGWMGFARVCRCRPGGTSGLDFVCEELPGEARWFKPWRYGLWRGVNAIVVK